MLPSLSLESRPTNSDSNSTKFYERRIVVKDGSINPVTLCTLNDSEVLRVWIPNSIVILNYHCETFLDGIGKEHRPLELIVFESNSHLTRIERSGFSSSSLQSILIPSNVETLGSKCFSFCFSLSSITFESNSCLTRIESEAFSYLSLQSILIPRNVEIHGSKCFSSRELLSSIAFESNSQLTRIESKAFHKSSLQCILIPSTILFMAYDAIDIGSQIRLVDDGSCPDFDRWLQLKRSGI
jgi:hypothetical protein